MSFKLIMPMAGNGSRFADVGYTDPKPMINVLGKPMFVHAVESIGLDFDDYIFITRKEHAIADAVKHWYPNSTVVEIDKLTEGAACTVLLADPHIDNDDSVMVANCDQVIQWDTDKFDPTASGNILCFHHPQRESKWSFAQVDSNNTVQRVAEKDPISDWATSGHYYWKRWAGYKDAAAHMISADDRTNGEYYLCPVYNHTVGTVKMIEIDSMHGIGTPEDLDAWLGT